MISLKKHFRISEGTIDSLRYALINVRGSLKDAKLKVSNSFESVRILLEKKKHLK